MSNKFFSCLLYTYHVVWQSKMIFDKEVNNKIVQNPKISIIVATFNNEKYIEKCVKSLIHQTFKDIEIIIVNDGSTDRTKDILTEFKNNDSRIILINQENKLQGAARNRALVAATGEYITFVDGDDWIDENYCEKLYYAAIKHNVNIAAAKITRDYDNYVKKHLDINSEKVFIGANNIVQGIDKHLETAGKLYKFELIKNIRFSEGVYYEDAPYSLSAILESNSLVTVPDTCYHYYSNPNSTIKQKGGIKNENDKVEMNLLLLDIANKNGIDLGDFPILKEKRGLFKIIHYLEYKDYYFSGEKIFRRKINFDDNKVFLVFNTAYLGDILLCNSLCQNIKTIFPKSKVVFVVRPAFRDIALHQDCVDDVVVYDRKGKHKGLFGLLKFILNFKYKKVFASFITYRNRRNALIAKLLKSRFIELGIIEKTPLPSQVKHNMLLEPLTHKKIINYPIKFNLPDDIANPVKEKDYIVLCTTSKKIEKDMKIETAIELIKKYNTEAKFEVVFVGKGNSAFEYAEKLKSADCKFIDLANKTSLLEMGAVLKGAKAVISVDTGTLHYSIALNKPVCAVFYKKNMITNWAPDTNLYNAIVISENQNAQNIHNSVEKLLGDNV